MKTTLFSLLIILLTASAAFSQLNCGTDHVVRQYYENNPKGYADFVEKELQLHSSLLQKSDEDTNLYIIPVVFHVLHMNGPENISDDQIIDGINVLNTDMRKMNADTSLIIPEFRHLAGKLNIEFRLATIDPDGNCTNGIDRIYTTRTNYGDDSAKMNPWPRDKYLNIWTAKALLQGWAGYAYYPSAADAVEVHDGLMLLANYIGSVGTSSPYTSRTLTHEVGHWLDLGHPWNTTINISINVGLACGDDLVPDTPVTKGHTTCPSNLRHADCTIDTIAQHYLTFDDVTTTSGITDPTQIPAALDHFVAEPFEAVGVSVNSGQAGAFAFSGWDTGAPDGTQNYADLTGALNTGKYYEWTFIPDTGYIATLSQVSFRLKRSADGPRTFAVRSSVNAFNTNISIPQAQLESGITVQSGGVLFTDQDTDAEYMTVNIPLSGIQYSQIYQPRTFRFYAWNSEAASGEFLIDSVSLAGTTGVIENIQNYMEYSYCTHMWTKGQCARMSAALNSPLSGRSNLWTQQNLEATGVLEPAAPCVPQPDFYASTNRTCSGNSITFTMNEVNAAATSQSWTFEGGTPASSTSATPTVLYANPGVYQVSLTTTNATGSASLTKTGFITIDGGEVIDAETAFYDDFGDEMLFNDNWAINNLDSNENSWVYDVSNGYSGPGSVYVNGQNAYYLEMDELVSPYYNLSDNSLALNFKLAAVSHDSLTTNDKLVVLFKKNCDSPWTTVKTINAQNLYNNPDQSSSFVPDGQTVWDDKSVNISASYRTDEFQFKFVYYSDYPTNRVYIDRINLGEPVGISDFDPANLDLQVFPVPSSGDFKLAYNLPIAAETQVKIMDVTGKLVYSSDIQLTDAGQQETSIAFKANKGIYFVVLEVNGRSYMLRQIIE